MVRAAALHITTMSRRVVGMLQPHAPRGSRTADPSDGNGPTLWDGKTARERRSATLTLCSNSFGLVATAHVAARPHQNLVVENLLIRRQLAVLTVRLEANRRVGFGSGQAAVDPRSPVLRRLAQTT